ncbi:MAG: hypothetical protein RJB38_1653 [Pseudomonadota bacterium]|jgi:hypothetical protein
MIRSARVLSVFLSLFLLCPFANAAKLRRNWIAFQINDEILTAQEVRNVVEAVVLSSDLHQTLYQQAGQNQEAYEALRDGLVDQLFAPTLGRLALQRVLELHAKRGEERRYFQLTKESFSRALDAQVRKALAPFGGDRNSFAESLRKQWVGDATQGSSEEVFSQWLSRLRLRFREHYRSQEVARYLCSLGNCAHESAYEIIKSNRSRLEAWGFMVLRPSFDGAELRGRDVVSALLETDQAPEVSSNVDASDIKNEALPVIERLVYLGRVVGNRVEFLHINDWNLLGPVGTALGYPKTDDFGRTSGFVLNYRLNGELGSLQIQLENWLFAENLPPVAGVPHQRLEEENALRIVSRHFLDESAQEWVIIGVSATHRLQAEGIGAWVQKNFHKLNSNSRPRVNEGTGETEFFLHGLLGVGGQYSIFESKHVDLVLSGEGLLAPALGEASQNSIQVRSNLDVNFYGNTKDVPIFQLGGFSDFRFRVNGQVESSVGVRAMMGAILRSWQVQAGLFVVRWDGELDRRYEHGESWTTGVMVSVGRAVPRPRVDYEF